MWLSIVLMFLFLHAACGDFLLEVEYENDPVGNFDALWHEFDRYYAAFEAREVDWDGLYSVYRPKVHTGSTDAELYEAATGLLSHLRDEHVGLYAPGQPHFQSQSNHSRPLFSDSGPDSLASDWNALFHTICDKYLDSTCRNASEYGLPSDFSIFGTINPAYTSLKIGYVLVMQFGIADDCEPYFDAIVRSFREHDGLIIDLRINGGGSSSSSGDLLSRIADRERAYATVRLRNGPDHGDFTPPERIYLKPSPNTLDPLPVTVLTSRLTGSAAEDIVLGVQVLTTAIAIGDTTMGILGYVAKKVLPNGWEFTLSPAIKHSIAGICYEGIGIPPDIQVMASRAEVDAGRDAVIDEAIRHLESISGGLRR